MKCAAPAFLALSIALVPACTETREAVGYPRSAPPRPRPSPPPRDARADVVVVNVGAAPADTDGNGYPDSLQVTAYLFDTRYPPPIFEDGTFVFLLYASGEAAQPAAQPLRQWRFADQALAGARARNYFGPCHLFRLSLLDQGSDSLGVAMADLACRFEPADGGDPARTRGVATIGLGRRAAIPGPPPAAPSPAETEAAPTE